MLLFDLVACQPVNGSLNHGGKEYAEAILDNIIERDIPIAGIFDSQLALNPKYIEYCNSKGGLIDRRQVSLQEAISSNLYTAFYSSTPYFYQNIIWGNVKCVGNIHGLRPVEVFTDSLEYMYSTTLLEYLKAKVKGLKCIERYMRKKSLLRISKLLHNPSFICITGSEHSKHTLLVHYPDVPPERINVFYDPLNLTPVTDSSLGNGSYFLLVSGNRWIKNTYRGIKALDELISAGLISKKVIVTGVVGKMRYLNEIKNQDYFDFRGYVSTEELANLYGNAYCLIFLSLSEGFGYPPLEAISRGTPAVCSPFTALYEVYQGGVLYCNPLSIDDIKVKILEINNPEIHAKYKSQGVEQGEKMLEMQMTDLPKLVDFILSNV